jgi:NADPH-dependent 2,4-dienoyl-CoA reductase/sulfur reductase-like enzyme
MAQFLSPYTNRRADVYGKDRGLFAMQTLERVRARVGSDYLVGYRMSGEEFIDGGVTLEETKAFARRLEERGIDYLHVSGGIIEVGEHFVIPMYFPKGYLLHLAEEIKQVVKVPVVAVGAIHDPSLAEESLKRKRADLIAMGRGLIADPELPRKVQQSRPEDIRTCLRCNEGCISRVRQGKTQRCAVNAEVGRERTLRIHPASRPKQVCVVGGGPAGMEAARVLAERRHKVTLIEKENELGGLLRFASVPDFKEELRGFLQYLKIQVKKTGVEVLMGRKASLDLLRELHPDSVVLAAGSTMSTPGIPGVERPFVAGALDLLSGKFQPGDRVVVVGGAAMGCEVAAHLASLGRKVTVVEMINGLALDLENRCRVALLQLLKERRVDTFTNWKMEAIGDRTVLLSDGNRNKKELTADSVILALGLIPNQELLEPLTRNFPEVQVIGDCLEPRKVYQAIHEGAFVGRAI